MKKKRYAIKNMKGSVYLSSFDNDVEAASEALEYSRYNINDIYGVFDTEFSEESPISIFLKNLVYLRLSIEIDE